MALRRPSRKLSAIRPSSDRSSDAVSATVSSTPFIVVTWPLMAPLPPVLSASASRASRRWRSSSNCSTRRTRCSGCAFRASARERMLGWRLQRWGARREPLLQLSDCTERGPAGHGLNAPHPGGDATLAGEAKGADLSGGADVGSAAELERRSHTHDPDHVSVFLREERHRSEG